VIPVKDILQQYPHVWETDESTGKRILNPLEAAKVLEQRQFDVAPTGDIPSGHGVLEVGRRLLMPGEEGEGLVHCSPERLQVYAQKALTSQEGRRALAPLVARNVQGILVKQRGLSVTLTDKPPRFEDVIAKHLWSMSFLNPASINALAPIVGYASVSIASHLYKGAFNGGFVKCPLTLSVLPYGDTPNRQLGFVGILSRLPSHDDSDP